MPTIGSNQSFILLTRSLTIAFFITIATLSTQAQVGNDDAQLPDISRVCLWNADHSTWKLLKLKRHQIERMNELRGLYPAVVDGQWIAHDEDVDQVPSVKEQARFSSNVSSSIIGPDAGSATMDRTVEPNSPATTTSKVGLQQEIRATLTPVQLLRWANHCQ